MLEISVDVKKAVGALDALSERQLPFAAMKTLNEIATTFQANEQNVMRQDFTIRRPWVLQGIKIDRGDFATKQNLRVRVHVDDSRDFLEKFEPGGTRTPIGSKGLSIPFNVRSSKQAIVPKGMRPKALHFHEVGGGVSKGDNRTFMIQRPDGSGLILQRKSRAVAVKKRQHGPLQAGQRHDNRLVVLFVLKPRTPVPASLHFYDTATTTFRSMWQPTFIKWWNEAIRTATPGDGGVVPQGMALPAGWPSAGFR